jgi:hypothetical protein
MLSLEINERMCRGLYEEDGLRNETFMANTVRPSIRTRLVVSLIRMTISLPETNFPMHLSKGGSVIGVKQWADAGRSKA